MPVRTMPGESALTRMPSRANSCASTCTSMIRAALLGPYAPRFACGLLPDIDAEAVGLAERGGVARRDLRRLPPGARVPRQAETRRPSDPARGPRHQDAHAPRSVPRIPGGVVILDRSGSVWLSSRQ